MFLLILNKPLICLRGNKMFLTLKCQRRLTTLISTCVDRMPITLSRTQNGSEHMLTYSSHASENTNCISTCVAKHPHACEDTICITTCVSEHLFANENTKSISTCVHLTPLMPARSTKVLNKG